MQPKNGFALAAAMMVLALLSVLGVAAIESTTLEVKISAHDRDARAALYVAEAALEEARYYTARGWGMIRPYSPEQVEVTTAMPAGFSWDGLAGFTLVDEGGVSYPIASVAGSPTLITMAPGSGDPKPGRFVIYRPIPPATWNAPYLDVNEPAWVPTSADYTGWLLWNGDGNSYKVQGTSTTGTDVRLRLSTSDPGPGPYALSLNPWLGALESGTAPPEDARTATPAWDREFGAMGRAEVNADRTTSGNYRGTYLLTSRGFVELAGVTLEREATLRVYGAGRPDQRVGDWTVR